MAKISISLERNNLSKKAKVGEIDRLIQSISDNPKVLTNTFELLCSLPSLHSAWIDKEWQMIVIADKVKTPVGGLSYVSVDDFVSTESIKIMPVAQGKGLALALLDTIVKLHGGIYSSTSISPGAALLFKKLSEKYRGYIVWPRPAARSYTPIASWGPAGIYKEFPFIRAPNGKEYPVDKLEDSTWKHSATFDWRKGEIFISKNKKPPVGMALIGPG